MRTQVLGKAVGWIDQDNAGFVRLRYLLPCRVTEAVFLSLPDAWVEFEAPSRRRNRGSARAHLEIAGFRVWVTGVVGSRELVLAVEKPAGHSPWGVVDWFEEGLEELLGTPIVRGDRQRAPALRLVA